MRLLLFMESYYCGGVDTFVINLINNWPGDADELILACNANHAGLENIKTSLKRPCRVIENKMKIFTGFFVKIRKLSVFDRCLFLILKLLAPILRYLFLIYNIFALRRVFGQIGADRLLVINGGYPGGDSCRAATISWGLLREKPLSIHNFHGIVTKPRWHIKIQEYFVDALMSKFTKTFVTVSDAAAKTMSCRKIIYKNNKILTVYSGIELNQNETTLDIKREIGMPID